MNEICEVLAGFKETEIGLIPEEWEVVKLGDLAEKMKAGGTPRRKEKKYWGGNIPFALIEDISSCGLYLSTTKEKITEGGLKNSSAWIIPPNSLLLSMYANIGETAINKIPLATNQAILAIIPKSNFNIKYGAYLLNFLKQRLISQNIQCTQKNINKRIATNFKIPLPPFSEQKQISNVLSIIQNSIEKTEAVIEASKELKKSLSKYLFIYGPVSIQEKENVILKKTEIGMIPEDWEVVKLGDVTKKTQYGYTAATHKKAIGTPLITISDIDFESGKVNYNTLRYVNIEENKKLKYLLKQNDLLIARTGKYSGKSHLVDENSNIIFGSYLIRFILDIERIIPNFFQQFTFHFIYWRQIFQLRSGAGQPNVNATNLKNILVPIPNIYLQKDIIELVDVIDEKIQTEQNKKTGLQQLFNTLLNNLMTGKIRVNHLEVPDA